MTFDELWKATVARNPALADNSTKITITAEQYRKALQQAYEIGEKAGIDSGRTERGSKRDPFSSIFGGL